MAPCFLCVALVGSARANETLRKDALALFGRIDPVTEDVRASAEVELGRALFWDGRISSDGNTACASCHLIRDWAEDSRPFSIDARGKATSRHSPTIFNSMAQPSMRWLGDRKDGADQAEGSIDAIVAFLETLTGEIPPNYGPPGKQPDRTR